MDTTLTEATTVVASKDQVSAPLAGETVILGMVDGVYYGLDAVATRVWELVQEPTTVGAMANVIAAEFDVTRDRALADLLEFVGALKARGLIEVGPAQAPR